MQMEDLIHIFLLEITILFSVSTAAHQVFYVLPDDSTNTTCPSQPCATLSQYLLDNDGSLPVVSNVEYQFLPGKHYVPSNMSFWHLHNFAIIGSSSNKFSVLLVDLQAYIKIYASKNFTISNVLFKMYYKHYEDSDYILCKVMLTNCFSCKIVNVTFVDYGFCGINLSGISHLRNIEICFTRSCYIGIDLSYDEDSQTYNNESVIVIDKIFMHGKKKYCNPDTPPYFKSGINAVFPHQSINNITYIISNSQFQNMGQVIIYIESELCAADNTVWIDNCTFEYNDIIHFNKYLPQSLIHVALSHYNATLTILNCRFFRNQAINIISVELFNHNQCKIPLDASLIDSSNVTIRYCDFIENDGVLMSLHSSKLVPSLNSFNYFFIGYIYIRTLGYYSYNK